MIVVLGRPGLTADGRLDRLAGRIAVAAAESGARVELVGSVGDDPDSDTVTVELGRAGVGHAALMRDPSATTPRGEEGETLPRLDAADVELGLQYLSSWGVLVVAEPLPAVALEAAVRGAAYHDASVVALTDNADGSLDADLPESATVLAVPEEDAGAFAQLVGRYAALLDAGRAPAEAWRDAVDETGWETAAE